MTHEQIKDHRLFLDDARRHREAYEKRGNYYRVPRTSTAPCQGCGTVERGRVAERVCDNCRILMLEGLDQQEALLREEKYELHWVAERKYYEGRYSQGSSWASDKSIAGLIEAMDAQYPVSPSDVIERMMWELARALSKELPTEDADATASVYVEQKGDSYRTRVGKMWLKPEHALLLRTLDIAIRKALADRTTQGERYGRGLLAQLATGDLSIAKFNELSTKSEEGRK